MSRRRVRSVAHAAQLGRHLRLLLVLLLLAGCGEIVTPTEPASGEASPTPPPSAVAPTPSQPPAPTTPPTSTVPAPTPTPQPDALAGRLLYVRQGNLHQWSERASSQLTSDGDLLWPRWSPDGLRIAAVRRGDVYSDLHLLGADGQPLAQLTQNQSKAVPGSKEYVGASSWAISPAWSPDGLRLIYASDATTSNAILWSVEAAAGSTPRPVSATADLGANTESPAYAPDGGTIVFCLSHDAPTQLWTIDVANNTRDQLTDGQQTVHDPAWAPDGKALAVAIVEGGGSGLWLLSPDAKQRAPLLRKPAARAPTWSPDGTQLAFIGEENGRFDVYVAAVVANGTGVRLGEARRLTSDGDVDPNSGLSWAR